MVSGGHDGHLKVWDLRKVGAPDSDGEGQQTEPIFVLEDAHKKK